MSLERYIPAIQEDLRRSGFPKFTKSKIHEIKFEAGEDPQANTSDRFEFQMRDGRTGVVLTANAVALHTNYYQHFEDFLGTFEKAVGLINPILRIDFAERIGLRYVDLVRPVNGETFDQYITEGILGPDPSSLGMVKSFSRFEMVGTSEVGTLALRHWQMSNGNFLPPDLLPSTLVHPTSLAPDELVSLLDFDHFAERQFDFDADEIKTRAWQLHDNLDRTFRTVTKPFALDKWGQTVNQGETK